MAESDENRPSGALSSEEADRLSERIKPSWETEPDPPTIPKVEPPRAPHPLKQTLVGIAVTTSEAPPTSAPSKAPDDLDWELPTNPVPSPLEEVAPSEPPPKSNPSGIGQTYKPKDVDAPAIVLKEEVQRAEEQARAVLEAEHRSRRAPTVLKFKVADVAASATALQKPAVEEEPPAPPRQKSLGTWIGVGAAALAVALIGIMVATGPASPPAALPEDETPAAAPAPPPEPAPAAVAPEEPAVPPAVQGGPDPSALPESEKEVTVEPVTEPEPVRAPVSKPKPPPPVPKPAPVSKAPKPAPPPAKPPATKPTAQKPGSAVIVRDSPF